MYSHYKILNKLVSFSGVVEIKIRTENPLKPSQQAVQGFPLAVPPSSY
jgi:hypothetical protein